MKFEGDIVESESTCSRESKIENVDEMTEMEHEIIKPLGGVGRIESLGGKTGWFLPPMKENRGRGRISSASIRGVRRYRRVVVVSERPEGEITLLLLLPIPIPPLSMVHSLSLLFTGILILWYLTTIEPNSYC